MSETQHELLAGRFQEHRAHLQAVAYRMLGSASEADDAVQEAWIRLSRSDAEVVENLGGWLTTVVARICLNMLRSRSTHRVEPLDEQVAAIADPDAAANPEDEALVADSVGLALLVVLDTLAPAERLAFVLHDMFAVPFEEIAPIVGRTPAATRQLASRARRRVQGAPADAASAADRAPDRARHREIVDAFLTASRAGEFEKLLALLDPQAVLRADAAGVAFGSAAEVVGAAAVAENFAGRARAARLATIDGAPGLVWSRGGVPQVVFAFTIESGAVTAIDLIADPERIQEMELNVSGS